METSTPALFMDNFVILREAQSIKGAGSRRICYSFIYIMLSKINKILFLLLLIGFAVSFFQRDNYRTVNEIRPEVLTEPAQQATTPNIIKFTRNEYEYEATPLYDYELNGLIVHKMDYTFFSIYQRDSVFPMDLCVIWGDNVKSGVFRDKNLTFSQDMRFCSARWTGNVIFDANQFSNNHLVANNDEMEKKMKSLSAGDQVKIIGKLVNIKAKNIGKPGKYDPPYFEWNTSTTRTDSGEGACETILVENIIILKKANPVFHYLYFISLYGLIALIVSRIIYFFIEVVRGPIALKDRQP